VRNYIGEEKKAGNFAKKEGKWKIWHLVNINPDLALGTAARVEKHKRNAKLERF